MSSLQGHTMAEEELAAHPDVRAMVLKREDFQRWKSSLPVIERNGTRFYIQGGDMLRNLDEIIVDWARRHGLLATRRVDERRLRQLFR